MTFENYKQRNLKILHILMLGCYALLAFVAPIINTCVWTCNSKMIVSSHRFPVIIIFIIAVFSIFAMHFLKKSVDKITVLNLDGSYNKKAYNIKIALKFVTTAVMPIILIIACVLVKEWLVSTMEELKTYLDIVMVDLAFVIASKFIDAAVIDPIEYELELRNKVAEENALSRRVNNLTNIE